MIKRLFLFLIFQALFLGASVSFAQEIKDPASLTAIVSMPNNDIYETARYRVYYQYLKRDCPDCEQKEGYTILNLGDRYGNFLDYSAYRIDSLYRDAAEKQLTYTEILGTIMMIGKSKVFDEHILFDYLENSVTTQKNIGLDYYQFEETLPIIDWNFAEGDSIISGFVCKKATASFRGRDYVAWYAEDLPLTFGPYKFTGLPGLIFTLYDTNGDHIFTIVGLEVEKYKDPIFLKEKRLYQTTTRKEAWVMLKNFKADPVRGLQNSRIRIKDEDMAKIKPHPFNPIELD